VIVIKDNKSENEKENERERKKEEEDWQGVVKKRKRRKKSILVGLWCQEAPETGGGRGGAMVVGSVYG
jgi:hypothetical protein